MVDLHTYGLANDFDLAGQAIEEMVHALHPNNDQYRWGEIKPMSVVDGWGLSLPNWTVSAGRILKSFQRSVAPRKITFSQTEIRNSGALPLQNLQLYLAQKAQHAFR